MTRGVSLLVAFVVFGAACGTGAGDPEDGLDRELVAATCEDDGLVEPEQISSTPREDVPSALDDRFDDALPEALVDPAEIRSGGPPPDGIPPIDEPRFVEQCSVDWLTASEPVLVLDVDGDARAYPVQIMTWHELVNDSVGGTPVTVSYCPLCNSAIAYDRRLDDRILDFGTSGSLLNSSLVMYDRQTETLWSHFTAEAVIGALTGTQLDRIPLQMVSFSEFRQAHPDGLVLSRDTGFSRDYGRNPYTGYDRPDASPFLFDGDTDPALPAMTRVVTVEHGDEAVAIVLDGLLAERVVSFEVGGQPLVAFAKPGTASALDSGSIRQGRDVGATGVFVPEVDGRQLSFAAAGDEFGDRETGSSWDIFGRATSGLMEGSRLEAVEHIDTFWFAWGAFRPDTRVLLADR